MTGVNISAAPVAAVAAAVEGMRLELIDRCNSMRELTEIQALLPQIRARPAVCLQRARQLQPCFSFRNMKKMLSGTAVCSLSASKTIKTGQPVVA